MPRQVRVDPCHRVRARGWEADVRVRVTTNASPPHSTVTTINARVLRHGPEPVTQHSAAASTNYSTNSTTLELKRALEAGAERRRRAAGVLERDEFGGAAAELEAEVVGLEVPAKLEAECVFRVCFSCV